MLKCFCTFFLLVRAFLVLLTFNLQLPEQIKQCELYLLCYRISNFFIMVVI